MAKTFNVWVDSIMLTDAGQRQVKAFGAPRGTKVVARGAVTSAFFAVGKGEWCPQVGDELAIVVENPSSVQEDLPSEGCSECGRPFDHTVSCMRGILIEAIEEQTQEDCTHLAGGRTCEEGCPCKACHTPGTGASMGPGGDLKPVRALDCNECDVPYGAHAQDCQVAPGRRYGSGRI